MASKRTRAVAQALRPSISGGATTRLALLKTTPAGPSHKTHSISSSGSVTKVLTTKRHWNTWIFYQGWGSQLNESWLTELTIIPWPSMKREARSSYNSMTSTGALPNSFSIGPRITPLNKSYFLAASNKDWVRAFLLYVFPVSVFTCDHTLSNRIKINRVCRKRNAIF